MTTESESNSLPSQNIGSSATETPNQDIMDVPATPGEEPAIGPALQAGRANRTTVFGQSFLAMFNRFLQHTLDAVQNHPEKKLMEFTWSNESKGRKDVHFFVDLKKDDNNFILEMGTPAEVKKMTLNFKVVPKGNFIALRRRNYTQEEHCIHANGVLWMFNVSGSANTFATDPFRKAVDRNSWLLDFLNRIEHGNKKPLEVRLSLNGGLNEEWKKSFHAAVERLLSGKDEDNHSYWTQEIEGDTESLMVQLENEFQNPDNPTSYEMAMIFFVSLIFRWFTCAVDNDDPVPGFPKNDDMHNVRPVDLNPYEVNAKLQEKGLNYPYQVIIAACSALNAGKHLILSGPPGNGKTELAIQLAKIAGVNPVAATANPSWTTAEMMGRYMPKEKGGLEFVPGYFLSAIENSNDKRWLLIDEFNRADIDTCMGELFTILSNQAVVLPFRAYDDGKGTTESAEAESVTVKKIAVVPTVTSEQDGADTERKGGKDEEKRPRQFDAALYKTYVVPPEFRIIATMNDSDASRLNPLSFALRRRFVILRVEAPAKKKREELITNRLKKIVEAEGREQSFYDVNQPRTMISEKFKNIVETLLFGLFANQEDNRQDLLDMRLIGVGQVLDVIDFIKEGLRAPNAGDATVAKDKLDFSKIPGRQDNISQLVASYAALAVEMMVLPQLDACDDANFETAVSLVADVFKSHDFLVVDAPDKDQGGKQVDTYFVKQHERYPKISVYLADKLKSQYSYQPDRLRTVEMIFGKKAES